jgi:hypothetical protein
VNPNWGFPIGVLIFLVIAAAARQSARGRRWEPNLRVLEGGTLNAGERPVFRPATFWEKVRYWWGLDYKGPKYLEMRKP